MTCKKMGRDMEAYLDGTLSAGRKAGFDGHLDHCAVCQTDLLRRQRLGKMLSGSLHKMVEGIEPPAKIVREVLRSAENEAAKSVRPTVLWPKFAAAAILPLLALALFFVFLQKRNAKAPAADFVEPGRASYLKLTTTHFAGPSSREWSVKRAYVKRSNGEAGSLTLELTRTM
ncbi:MAG TPA: zf-HC2 domain-containing protein [Patescibacteria group bacterium]|nr:zf-HC2 domain-containing protein [Patescibacteria group bacterium]